MLIKISGQQFASLKKWWKTKIKFELMEWNDSINLVILMQIFLSAKKCGQKMENNLHCLCTYYKSLLVYKFMIN